MTEGYWLEWVFRTHMEDPELQVIDVLCQLLGDDRLTNEQCQRMLTYAMSRYGVSEAADGVLA